MVWKTTGKTAAASAPDRFSAAEGMEKVSRLFNGVPDVDPDGINLNTLTKLRHGKTQFLTAVGGNPISLQSAASGSRTQTFPDESGTILTNVTANIVKNNQNNAFGAFYQDLAQRTAPPNPSAGTRRIYVDSVTGKISVRTSAGISISLEEQDTIFDPDATQTFNNKTIPFGTNTLTDVVSTNTAQEITGSKTWIGNHIVAHNKLRVQVANGTNFISFNLPALTTSLDVTFPNLAAGDTFLFEGHPTTITGAKHFNSEMLRVWNPAGIFYYSVRGSAIASNFFMTLPFLDQNDIFAVLTQPQTFTGLKIFNSSALGLKSAGAASFLFAGDSIAANKTVNIPALAANDNFVFENHVATLKGKTMDAVDNAMLNQEVYPEAKRLVGGWNGGSATIGGWGFANGLMVTVGSISYLQGTAIGKAASFASAASVNAQAGIRLLDGGGAMLHDRFRFKCKIRYQNIPSISGARVFVGVTNRSNGFLSGEDPLNGLRGALMCLRANDTTWQFAHNDHLDAGVYDNTGVARNTTPVPFVWEIRAVSDTELQWRYNEGTWSASVTTEIPQLAAPLYPVLMIESVDGTAKTFDTRYWYMEIQSTV